MASKEIDIEKAVEEFFSDPKHSKDATFMRAAVKKVYTEIKAEEKEKSPKEQPSIFDRIFGGARSTENPDE